MTTMEPPEKRRVGREHSETRASIIDATEHLMIEEGYAAVTARRVATQASVKPALVQYYFPTMQDLMIATYRRAADRSIERQATALAAPHPLEALWSLGTDADYAVLAVEFMALANHRKAIRDEIASYNERARQAQAQALTGTMKNAGLDLDLYPAAGLSQLLAGAARGLVMEASLGITAGHREAREIVERWLKAMHPHDP